MSQNIAQKSKFPTFSNNPSRGHPEFGQAGYSQYGFPTALQSVPANPAHDMSKQVPTPQSGMYANSGGMPSAAHHHQGGMTGPAPSPQPSSLVNPPQQMNRAHIQMPNYYSRNNVPRTVPNMGRSPMPTVVNQAPQQQTSQYSHTVQMVPSHSIHQIAPIIVNPGIAPQMYSQGRYPQPYAMINPSQPAMYNNMYWSNYNNTPHGNANGFYQPHQLSTYSMNPPMNTQQTPAATQQAKKRLAIIDPTTGKNILEGVNEETPVQKDEAHDDSICIQFATQVAQVLGTEKKTESTLKTSPVESSRIVQSAVLCPPDVETVNSIDELDTNSVDVCEQFVPGDIESSVPFYNKDSDLNNVPDSFESKPAAHEAVSVVEPSPVVFNVLNEEVPVVEEDVKSSLPEDNQTVEKPAYSGLRDDSPVSSADRVSPETAEEPPQANVVVEESLTPNLDNIDSTSSTVKSQEKTESKKKTKKKKEINKKGESKEGGDMDAFLDKVEKVEELPPTSTPVPTTVAPANESTPPVSDTQAPSPVPILDSEILSTIPLPGETVSNPKSEEIVKEPAPDDDVPPVVSDIENDKENITEDSNAQTKIVLKYNYKEDQWSPLNPEGKKQYDRDFLLQLQSQPMSLCKPSNLPNLDVIKDKAHIQRLTEVNRAAPMPIPVRAFDPFMPNYARTGNTLRPPHPVNRRSQQGRGDKKQKIIVLPTNQNIKLHESENAWKPSHKVAGEKTADETAEIEDLYRKVRGILNKLTPQKFETLVEQVKNLDINTEEKLNGVIDLVFEKAIDEPNFSVPYANMCKHLALIRVPLDGQPGGQVQFRKLLLTKCQKEFEQDRRDELRREEKMKVIEAADPEKRKELQLEFEEEEKKMRMRQLGNIRFIGELFKLNMLIEPIMHECIKKLLSQSDEESLECLCRLLKTIGKELDEKGNKNPREANPMDQYFAQMQKIVDKRLTSSRVRFMLQDVIDLKKNNWVPRRDENNPKTIDQIHKEAEREAREAQQVYQNMSYSKRPPDDRRKISGRNMGASEDGWTPTSKSNKGSYNMVDPSKLKLTKPDEVDSIRLGPGGRGPQSWSKGSSGGNRANIDSDVKTALTNRYSALADQSLTPSFENRRGSQRSAASSRESSRGRNSQLPPVRKTPSTSRERESLIETVKELNRNMAEQKPTEVKKTETQLNGKTAESVAALALNGPELSEDEMERKTTPLIDEFLHNADFEEAIKCLTELASPSTVNYFIHYAINQVLERSSQSRYLLGQLLCSLVKKELITLEQYKKGLSGILENINEYALDIPKIWEYMGEILEPMIDDNKLPLAILKDVLEPCIPSLTAGKLVSAVLHCAIKKKGNVKLGELWRESGLQWTDFLDPSTNIEDFLFTHKLEFTVSQKKVIPSSDISTEEIRTKIRELLEAKAENEVIFDWIDAKVPPHILSEPSFIRALSQEVHKASINEVGGKYELDQAMLKKRLPLLTRYIGHNEKLELQALYAVQHLMNDLDQPKGVLRQIFDMLYDDDVITEETFKVWEQSKDPSELEGKGVALLSVRGFFTWLREADSGEDLDDE